MQLSRIVAKPASWAALLSLPALLLVLAGCPSPEAPLRPWSSDSPMAGRPFACSTQTADPTVGQVAYQFDWGDGNQSEWSLYVAGSSVHGDTHTYGNTGEYDIRARSRESGGRTSKWSEPLSIAVSPSEGQIRWSFTYTDPEDPEDSSDFSLNTFGIADDGTAYIGCDFGRLVARGSDGRRKWEFPAREFDDPFLSPPAIGDDGTIYIGCDNDSLYAIQPNGTQKWQVGLDGVASGSPALGADGEVYVQTEADSLYSLAPATGGRIWAYYSGGGKSSPVIGQDGTIYCANQDGVVHAITPEGQQKWSATPGAGIAVNASPAVDPDRGLLYVVDEDGWFAALNLGTGQLEWRVANAGEESQSPAIGGDGTVYLGAGGRLVAISPENEDITWYFTPPLEGAASSAAVSDAGIIYFLVSLGKRDLVDRDSLYAVNADGSRRWAAGLYAEGFSDDVFSAPKLDAAGNIYIGNGLAAWCVVGNGGPAQSAWPMFQRDARNTGRTR